MNILITGGLGYEYVRGRVANYFKEKESHTHIFTTTWNRKLPNWTERLTVLEMNVLEGSSIVNCLKGKNINIIIHLAALNEIHSMKGLKLALKVNS